MSKKCSYCSSEISDDSIYCPVCGVGIASIENIRQEVHKQRLCKSCGAEINADANFCMRCGAKCDSNDLDMHVIERSEIGKQSDVYAWIIALMPLLSCLIASFLRGLLVDLPLMSIPLWAAYRDRKELERVGYTSQPSVLWTFIFGWVYLFRRYFKTKRGLSIAMIGLVAGVCVFITMCIFHSRYPGYYVPRQARWHSMY